MSFDYFWNEAKVDIFRLQLLDTYLVESEKENFDKYNRGEYVEDSQTFIEWKNQIKEKSSQGVHIINMAVVTLPLSQYKKFGIATALLQTLKLGQESFYVEREKVSNEIKGFEDYWMFDRKVVIKMKYDEYGHFLKMEDAISNAGEVKRYVILRDSLLKKALPLLKFLEVNNIQITKT